MQSSQPFFSIILPTYNRSDMLRIAIGSVFMQDFPSWELIIVDDGSQEDIKSVVESYNDTRVKYIHQVNSERSAARNNGIKNSKGRYICFLDNDDVYLPFHLSSFYKEIQDRNYEDGFYMSGHNIESKGKELSRSEFYSAKFDNPVVFAFETLPFPDDVCLPRHLCLANPFPEQFNIFEDGHVWLRILSRYPIFQIYNHTCIVNEHPGRSTNEIFEQVDVEYLKCYIRCAQHLFNHYGELLEPFFPRDRWRRFIISKLITVAQIAVARGKHFECRSILRYMIKQEPTSLLNLETIKLGLMSAK